MGKLRVLELFAGIGSWKKALDNLLFSYEIVDAIENDENVMKCYNLIHNTNYTARDIRDIDGNIYSATAYENVDLVLYSPLVSRGLVVVIRVALTKEECYSMKL